MNKERGQASLLAWPGVSTISNCLTLAFGCHRNDTPKQELNSTLYDFEAHAGRCGNAIADAFGGQFTIVFSSKLSVAQDAPSFGNLVEVVRIRGMDGDAFFGTCGNFGELEERIRVALLGHGQITLFDLRTRILGRGAKDLVECLFGT